MHPNEILFVGGPLDGQVKAVAKTKEGKWPQKIEALCEEIESIAGYYPATIVFSRPRHVTKGSLPAWFFDLYSTKYYDTLGMHLRAEYHLLRMSVRKET